MFDSFDADAPTTTVPGSRSQITFPPDPIRPTGRPVSAMSMAMPPPTNDDPRRTHILALPALGLRTPDAANSGELTRVVYCCVGAQAARRSTATKPAVL